MATEIRFTDGPTLTVADEYREVYEKFLATNWQMPCEFTENGEPAHPVTINPVYVACFRSV